MTLEQRAKAIADRTRYAPGGVRHSDVEAFALRMLQEASADDFAQIFVDYGLLQRIRAAVLNPKI